MFQKKNHSDVQLIKTLCFPSLITSILDSSDAESVIFSPFFTVISSPFFVKLFPLNLTSFPLVICTLSLSSSSYISL